MEKLIEIKEFKLLSRQFRRFAGDLLNSEDTYEAMRLAKRFINFIDSEPIISDFISKNFKQDYNISQIIAEQEYYDKFEIPLEINEEVSFIYQLLKHVTGEFDRYDTITRSYAIYRGAKISDSIRAFNREVVKLFVNHITDYLDGMSIELGIDEKPNAKFLVQGNVGQLNFTETGDLHANQINNQASNQELLTVAKELITHLKKADIENINDKEDAIDFVEEATITIESGNIPKPSLIRRATEALNRVRTVAEDGTFLASQIDKVVHGFVNIL
ncbi:hypothetical protein M1K46_02365 [Fictibacillus sp. WQ 8-8]|uniref:hypothetical protein n=1 Tax=Fictibacillus sp. WQ 8-8 TaxID=2938788 RepID=UPI00210AABC3|nr:hypothetical protein [Fictibacillus sp. WQ 8-8]MCQ6264510.1 hypothetical protein [Fictibacillus sp. WQ 8-8]